MVRRRRGVRHRRGRGDGRARRRGCPPPVGRARRRRGRSRCACRRRCRSAVVVGSLCPPESSSATPKATSGRRPSHRPPVTRPTLLRHAAASRAGSRSRPAKDSTSGTRWSPPRSRWSRPTRWRRSCSRARSSSRPTRRSSLRRSSNGCARPQPDCIVYAEGGFVGATPELLVRRSGRVVVSQPMAGTVPRARRPRRTAARSRGSSRRSRRAASTGWSSTQSPASCGGGATGSWPGNPSRCGSPR